MSKLTKDQENDFINEYINTDISVIDLCDKYNVTTGVFYHLKKYKKINLKKKVEKKYIRKCNNNFFENLDNEKSCYWAGFILGDGCINDYCMRIQLSAKDQNHLEKFKKDIECDYAVNMRSDYNCATNSMNDSCRISISRKKICEDLANHYIGKDKSNNCRLPNLPDHLINHFIRGLFDADGSFCIRKNNAVFNLYSSAINILFEIQEVLIKNCDLNKTKIGKIKNNNCHNLVYGGNTQVKRIMSYLYKNSTVKLDRKYDLFVDHYRFLGYDI